MKIYERHKVQMDKNRIKEIEYMLSLGIATTSISRYFGYDKRVTLNYIKQNIIKDVRLKQHLCLTNDEIHIVLKFESLLGKEILSTYDMKKHFIPETRKRLYECAKLWGYRLNKKNGRKEIKESHYKMIEIGWFEDLYEMNEMEKQTVNHFIEDGYNVWGLKNCGADFIIEKNGEYIVIESKTTLGNNTLYMGILQLLFTTGIMKEEFDIIVNRKILVYNKMNFNETNDKRYLTHFQIETLYIGKH